MTACGLSVAGVIPWGLSSYRRLAPHLVRLFTNELDVETFDRDSSPSVQGGCEPPEREDFNCKS